VRLGRTCVGFEQQPDRVIARFVDGTTAIGDLLVGADGLHSRIRATLHGESHPSYAGYTVWRAVVRFDPARITAGETWGPRGRFGIFPVRDGRVYWYASVNAPEGERAEPGERRLLQRVFDGYHDPIPALIEASAEESIVRNDSYDRPPLARWGEGCVTLLGDAAHPMTPNLGQGACQAIEDAIVLAERLRGAADVPGALRAYEQRRLERTRRIVERSRALGRLAQLENRALAALRDAVMPIAAPLQKMEIERILGAEL
jgi:2-polyprenyl-6-methoxyphenol hydroxylase-like FAD-dependent oxidoreductase